MNQYHTNLGYQPPVTPDIQNQRMREMSRYAPAGAEDVYASSLNLPAYQREAEMANMNYRMKNQSMQRDLALSGLAGQAEERAGKDALVGSILSGLMRYV